MSFLKRVQEAAESPVVTGAVGGLLAQLDAVREFMTAAKYPDGQARELATATVFLEDGVVKVCFSDRDQGRTLWRSGRTLEDAFLAVEAAIVDGTADWRKAAGGRAAKGGNGRK